MIVVIVVAIVVAVILIVAVSDWWDRHPDRRPRFASRMYTPLIETEEPGLADSEPT
jgi:hypothetical protein